MFSFFNKKKFLVDSLNGFVDIHNHILPGIDDGAKTVEDSLELIRSFESIGISRLIATPHIMNNYYPNTRPTIEKAQDTVLQSLASNNLDAVSLEASAEHMIDDNYETLLEKNEVLPMKGSYLLIEMSYLQPPINFEEALTKTAEKRYFPILAHPERYGFLHYRKRKYKEYKDQGILFQMNLLSLSDYYGKEVNKMAIELLDEGLIDFVGTDIHNQSQFNRLKEISLSDKIIEKLLPLINNTIQNFY